MGAATSSPSPASATPSSEMANPAKIALLSGGNARPPPGAGAGPSLGATPVVRDETRDRVRVRQDVDTAGADARHRRLPGDDRVAVASLIEVLLDHRRQGRPFWAERPSRAVRGNHCRSAIVSSSIPRFSADGSKPPLTFRQQPSTGGVERLTVVEGDRPSLRPPNCRARDPSHDDCACQLIFGRTSLGYFWQQ